MKIALVTGASRGIGFEFCRQLLKSTYFVVAAVRKTTPDLENLIGQNGEIITLDVSKVGSISEISEQIQKAKHIDLLINNAGVYKKSNDELRTLPEDLIESIKINSLAPLIVYHELKPLLKKSLAPVVANITSLMGSIADNTSGGSYGNRMSKAALNMGNKSLAIDNPEITSVVLHPGWVRTAMGGPGGALSTEESVTGMINVIQGLKKNQSGKFFDYLGRELPW